MTLIPDLLVTGILAVLFSLLYFAWAVFFVQRQHGGQALMLICIPMLLFGGGIFPPVLGALIGAAATRIHSSPVWLRKHFTWEARQRLQSLWAWFFAACLICWLGMFPGVPALAYFFGIINDALIFALLAGMFAFLSLAMIAGFARDMA